MSNVEELTGEELFDIIVAANVELQKILSLLLTIYADVHALTNHTIPGKNALYTLLTSNFDYLQKDVIKNYVAGKLYTSQDRLQILPDVDSRKLDSNLLLDILIKYLLTSYSEGICVNCNGTCCPKHDHNLRDCNKCRKNGNTPTDKCWHKCRSCKKDAKECQNAICCISCNICIPCNDIEFSNDVNNILADLNPLFLTCPWYIIIASLEIAKHFRNLFGHVTIEECKEFIENGKVLKEQFAKCKGPEQLQNYVTFVFQNIVNHAKVKLSELPYPSAELKDGLDQTMVNLKNIFCRNAPQHLGDISEVYNIFDEGDVNFSERLKTVESRISKMQEDLESHISETKEDVESKISETTEDLETCISETKENLELQISETKEDVASQISEMQEDLESQISETKEDLESQISETKEDLESQISEIKKDIIKISDICKKKVLNMSEKTKGQEDKGENEELEKNIYHDIIYKGKNWSFSDVCRLLFRNKDYETFRELLKYNGTMLNNMRDNINRTFLMNASNRERHDIVQYLTKQFSDEIDVWAVDVYGQNAYHYAAMRYDVDVMKVLLLFDRSRFNVGDIHGWTPLHRAARNNNKRMIELLLDAWVDVDVADNNGYTPDRHPDANYHVRKMIENHRMKKLFMAST